MKKKIFIIDNQKMFRQGLALLLQQDENLKVVGGSEFNEDALKAVSKKRVDIFIVSIDYSVIDIHNFSSVFPARNKSFSLNQRISHVLTIASKLKSIYPKSKLIILSSIYDVSFLKCAMDYNFDAFVLSSSDFSELINAIKMISANEKYISEPIYNDYQQECAISYQSQISNNLTKREVSIIRLLSEGKSNKEIANELSLSEKTVKNHITSIFKKLGVSDRTQAAIYSLKHNII